MKAKLIILTSGLALLLAMALGWSKPAHVKAAQPALAAQGGMPGGQGPMHREGHPKIREGIRQLEAARATLERGAHDFGGHRVKAIQLTNAAIRQLHMALRFDKH